jgi:exosome complex exonuclease RRP6
LLKLFVNFDADKKYQMADWRLRPLPEEMLHYARADTHYLLYIYDHLRNELLDKSDRTNPEENKIELVLQKSKETSLLRYSRQIYDKETGQGPGGWYNLLVKTAGLFSKEQFSVFRAIHAWRDQIARKDDDSTTYVMPNHTIFSVAKAMPEDMTQLYSVLHPISYNVKSRISDLLHVIKEAKEKGKDGPSMMDVLRADSVAAIAKHAGLQGDSNRSTPLPEPTTIVAENQDLRSNVSTFWGSAFGSSIWDSSSATVNGLEGIRLAVPMPDVLQETTVSAVENPVASTPVEPPTKEVAEDEPFTIKNGSSSSKKRKARDLEPSPVETPAESAEADGDGDYDISLHAPDEEALAVAERQAERKRRKKEKKAAKRAALESASGSTSATPKPTAGSTVSLSGAIAAERGEGDEAEDEDEEEEEAPFDYSSAPSVLHRKEERNSKGGKGEGKKGKGKGKNMGVNPYAKSANAMKGMRKVQSGTGVGKSHTFRK